MPETLTKGAFAARRGVGVSAVSNWISRGKLAGAALTADGRIDVAVAERQLGASVDPSRSTGQSLAQGALSFDRSTSARMAEIKLDREQMRLQQERDEFLARRGVYVRSEDVAREFTRQIEMIWIVVEQRMTGDLIGTRLNLGKTETIIARKWLREVRKAVADMARAEAAERPEYVEDAATHAA